MSANVCKTPLTVCCVWSTQKRSITIFKQSNYSDILQSHCPCVSPMCDICVLSIKLSQPTRWRYAGVHTAPGRWTGGWVVGVGLVPPGEVASCVTALQPITRNGRIRLREQKTLLKALLQISCSGKKAEVWSKHSSFIGECWTQRKVFVKVLASFSPIFPLS